MPAIWSSSERPLSVRTVWVDGIRHAILSPDDPLVHPRVHRRPQTSKEKGYLTKLHELESGVDRLNSCFTNLHVVVERNITAIKTSPKIMRRLSAPPCPKLSSDITGGSADFVAREIEKKADRDQNQEKGDLIKVLLGDAIVKSEIPDEKSSNFEDDSTSSVRESKSVEKPQQAYSNPLSERVLQWLDLSGRSQDYDFVNNVDEYSGLKEDRKWSPVGRRISPRKGDGLSFMEKERVIIQNYKLQKEYKSEYIGKGERKVLRKRLAKLRDVREVRDNTDGEPRLRSVPSDVRQSESSEKKDREGRNAVKVQEKTSTWSPPGRLELHIIMPNLRCKDRRASSQESLSRE